MKSRFVNDVKQEHILTPILVDIVSEFLNIYNMSANLISFEDDADAQYQGIDFVMSNSDNSSSWNVDLKCQTNEYINSPTPTFSLELCYQKDGVRKLGWFIKNDNLTDYYLFAWIKKANLDENQMITSKEQIEYMDFMFVKKEDIYKFLGDNGFTASGLLDDAFSLVASGERMKKICSNHYNVKLVCSTHLAEKPVNIIVSKYTYLHMPNTIYLVYEKGKGLYRSNMLVD